jgi:hypothetical protein
VPNPDGESQKDAPIRRYPILDSRADLRAYLNHYHVDPRDEAPLWPVSRGYDYNNPDNCALSGDRIRGILKECAARADVEKPVNPHNFRHTAVSRLSRAGYTPDEIKQFTGWNNNRMLERYTHVTDRDRNDQIHVKAGYLDEADTGTGPIAPKICGNCRENLKQTERFCPNCGFGATADAHLASKRLDEQFLESAALASGETARELLVVRRLLDELPALRNVLSDN